MNRIAAKVKLSATLALSAFVLLCGFNNCSPVDFQSTELATISNENIDSHEDGHLTYSATLQFQPTTANKPLDLVWVIDNSGSMNQEAAHVNSNFNDFLNSVGSRADLKVALISRAGTGLTSVSLNRSGENYLQIDTNVGSTNGPALLAQALCPSLPDSGPACSNPSIGNTASIRSALQSFLRPESKKAFIFVTDDNSNLNADKIRSVFGETLPDQNPTIFGFVALSAQESPCLARVGSVYQELVAQTSGDVFNICDKDWAPTFSRLADSVVLISNKPFPIPNEIRTGEILSIYLDGVMLTNSQYRITAEGLILDPLLAPSSGSASLMINYMP